MSYFPFFIDIENKSCIIIGGGRVALRKVQKLKPFNPEITVIAPEICNEIKKLGGITLIERSFEENDLRHAFMVISATDDIKLNADIPFLFFIDNNTRLSFLNTIIHIRLLCFSISIYFYLSIVLLVITDWRSFLSVLFTKAVIEIAYNSV